MACVLGVTLAALLAAMRGAIPGLFSADAACRELVAALLPAVILSQPVNAAAFVADGVLFGFGGFKFASVQMAACAAPAVWITSMGAQQGGVQSLYYVWAGLIAVMTLRAVSIGLAYRFRWGPFAVLRMHTRTQQAQ